MMTRRSVLRLAVTAPLLSRAFAASHDEFWNSKDPSQWSDKETTQMLTHSPWAKQAAVESPNSQRSMMPGGGGMGRGGGGGMGGGMGMPGGMGGGGVGGGRSRGGDAGGNGAPDVHAVVRWESASPVSAALKKSPPPEAAESYVLSVTGLRARQSDSESNSSDSDSSDREEQTERRMLHAASLEMKGKESISASKAEKVDDVDGPIWRFSFPRSGNPITAEDKEVTFLLHMGRYSLKAKFALKEMTYKDQLAL